MTGRSATRSSSACWSPSDLPLAVTRATGHRRFLCPTAASGTACPRPSRPHAPLGICPASLPLPPVIQNDTAQHALRASDPQQ